MSQYSFTISPKQKFGKLLTRLGLYETDESGLSTSQPLQQGPSEQERFLAGTCKICQISHLEVSNVGYKITLGKCSSVGTKSKCFPVMS